ncbi:unnamed protein product [Urochloa humidicola]
MAGRVEFFPAAVRVLLVVVAAAVFVVRSASASWHAQVFVVGGEPRGWAQPDAPDDETYNHWAARNRFHVGDFLHFKYDKNDSVLVVSRDDYKFCGASRPAQRFEGGDTRIRLDHSGFCYYISGAPGHCDAGQRMTVRVLPPFQDGGGTPAPAAEAPAAAMAPEGGDGGGDEDEGGSFQPPPPGSGSGGGSISGPRTSASALPPPHPHGAAGAGGDGKTSGAAARGGGCGGCHHVVVVWAVLLVASLLLLLGA